jgi:hypothetical protein
MKLKLSRTAWLILSIGIFVIAVGGLYMVYRGQVAQQQELNTKLSQAQAELPPLVSQREDLEGQLAGLENDMAQVISSLESNKAKFPESVDSIEYGEVLFNIADDSGLKIVILTASGTEDEEVDGIIYSVTLFDVVVKGEVDDVLDFVHVISTSDGFTTTTGELTDFTTATVELVDISVPDPLSEEVKEGMTAAEMDEAESPSAAIKITVYSYKGE